MNHLFHTDEEDEERQWLEGMENQDEPEIKEVEFFHSKVIKDLDEFKKQSDMIVANRMSEDISDVKDKVYTRDLFNND